MNDIKYTTVRSDRRSVCITVKPDLSIVVRAPHGIKQSEIDSFVLSKHDWIVKTIAKMRSATAQTFTYGSKIKLFGEELTVTSAECKKAVLSDSLLLVPKEPAGKSKRDIFRNRTTLFITSYQQCKNALGKLHIRQNPPFLPAHGCYTRNNRLRYNPRTCAHGTPQSLKKFLGTCVKALPRL